MKTHSSAASLALAVLAVIGLAGPAPAGEQVPFKGSLEGLVTRSDPPPPIHVNVVTWAFARGHSPRAAEVRRLILNELWARYRHQKRNQPK